MNSNDLKLFTDDEIANELDRRKEIREGSWPRSTRVFVEYNPEDDADYINFLINKCGLIVGSKQYNEAISLLDEMELEIEISKDGAPRFSKVSGAVVSNLDEKPNETASQAEESVAVDTLNVGG